jgi:hypothetical protein
LVRFWTRAPFLSKHDDGDVDQARIDADGRRGRGWLCVGCRGGGERCACCRTDCAEAWRRSWVAGRTADVTLIARATRRDATRTGRARGHSGSVSSLDDRRRLAANSCARERNAHLCLVKARFSLRGCEPRPEAPKSCSAERPMQGSFFPLLANASLARTIQTVSSAANAA